MCVILLFSVLKFKVKFNILDESENFSSNNELDIEQMSRTNRRKKYTVSWKFWTDPRIKLSKKCKRFTFSATNGQVHRFKGIRRTNKNKPFNVQRLQDQISEWDRVQDSQDSIKPWKIFPMRILFESILQIWTISKWMKILF